MDKNAERALVAATTALDRALSALYAAHSVTDPEVADFLSRLTSDLSTATDEVQRLSRGGRPVEIGLRWTVEGGE